MLKIRARSSRDGQVKSDLVPTARGIGPDGTVGISSPSTLATTGIFCCKGVDHGEKHAPVRLEAQGQTAVQCRENKISQQQKNSSREVLTQIVHEPGRLVVQGQTAVQCRQNENLQQPNCSGGVSTQIGHTPVRLETQGQTQQFQRRQSDSSQQQNSSRAVSNQIGHAPVRLEAATTESREVRVSDTSHLKRPTEIPNSLGLAKPAADRDVMCRKSKISLQQNGGGAVSTQIGHTPVRLEAQGQTAVQCRQNEISQEQKNSSRAVSNSDRA